MMMVPSIKTPMDFPQYTGGISFDGFKGKYHAGMALFAEKDGMFVVRGTIDGIVKDLYFLKPGVDYYEEITFQGAIFSESELKDVVAKFKNWEPRHCQLGGCVFDSSTFNVSKIESISEGVYEVYLYNVGGAAYAVYVDLNMHNPAAPGVFKPTDVKMFGETIQVAAAMALTRHLGVNVLSGVEKSSQEFADSQLRFLRGTAKQEECVTTSVASVMGSTPVKIRLDRITTFIAEAFTKDPSSTLQLIQHAFTREAKNKCSLHGPRLLKEALGLDIAAWRGSKTVGIFNRITPTDNNPHMDLTAAQIEFLVKAVGKYPDLQPGCSVPWYPVTRVLVFGDTLTAVQKAAFGNVKGLLGSALEVIDLTNFWKWDSFKKCFGTDVDFSAQCYIQLALQQCVSITLGSHSGGTEYLGFIGSPVIFWTSTDHPGHPRMPRLTASCDWWWCIPVGSTNEIKAANMKEHGFPELYQPLLSRAINHALTQVKEGINFESF